MPFYYNPTPGPVVVDDGRVVGGGEHVELTGTELVRSHVTAGRLVRTADPEPTKTTTKDAAKEATK